MTLTHMPVIQMQKVVQQYHMLQPVLTTTAPHTDHTAHICTQYTVHGTLYTVQPTLLHQTALLFLGGPSATLQMLDKRLRLEGAVTVRASVQGQLVEEAGHLAIVVVNAISICRQGL